MLTLSVVLMLFVMVSNFVVGFYIAVQLGFGPRDIKKNLAVFFSSGVIQELIRSVPLQKSIGLLHYLPLERFRSLFSYIPVISFQKMDVSVPTPSSKSKPEKSDSQSNTEEDESAEVEAIMEKMADAPVGDLLYDEADDILELSPMQEIFDDALASALMEQGTEAWLVNEKHVETSLLRLNTVMMKSGRFAAELDKKIRSNQNNLTPQDITRFIDEMRDDCTQYLQQQATITDQMKARLDEFGELKNLAEDIDFANMEQSSQIETTVSNLNQMKPNSANTGELASNLIKELANLCVARYRLRDMQDRTYMNIVFYEKRVDTIPQQLYFDERFGVRGRVGLEVAVYEWWKQNRHQTRQITFALLDFVKFSEINLEHGITPCDTVIKYFGKMLTEQFDSSDLVGIYSGNCFMVATVNMGPKKTITEIERVRQRCEKTTFSYNGEQFNVLTTCAVIEALATQTQEDVMKVLESTLATAKKRGRNHTFHFVPNPLNKPPELIEAPNLGEEPKEVDLNTLQDSFL
jgi:diguanylate cyclase (GGDEF)-like protein